MTIKSKKETGLAIVICIEKDDPGYHAFCPKLRGLHVYGKTEAEAAKSAKDAILAYLTSLVNHDESIPAGLFYREGDPGEDACPRTESIVQRLELVTV